MEVPGSGPPEEITRALAQAFNARHGKELIVVPPSTGGSAAIDAIMSGKATLARITRANVTSEHERRDLRRLVFAREAIVFATGASVTVSNLTAKQLAAIFSGHISDWSEVGGRAGAIRVVVREETEVLLRAIRNQLPEFAPVRFTADSRLVNRDYEMLNLMETYGRAIGWGSLSNVRSAEGLRVLSLDGVAPGPDTLSAGKYPLFYEALLVFKEGELKGVAKQFVDFVASPEGKRVIETLGALPLQAAPERGTGAPLGTRP